MDWRLNILSMESAITISNGIGEIHLFVNIIISYNKFPIHSINTGFFRVTIGKYLVKEFRIMNNGRIRMAPI
jgi:hypothetical protein